MTKEQTLWYGGGALCALVLAIHAPWFGLAAAALSMYLGRNHAES